MTTSERAVRDEPEPIDAEFEPKSKSKARRDRAFAPPPMRSRSASRLEVAMAAAAAAAVGAITAIIVTNANSGAPTGTLASEVDALSQAQDDLGARITQATSDVVALRSRLDAQADRLDRQDESELAARSDISALTAQVSALIGAGSGADASGALASNSPLGALLARINKLEAALSDDAAAPKTTKQVQRSIADLSAQITALETANATLSGALDQRQAALAALEDGMKVLSSEVSVLRGSAAASQKFGVNVGVLRKPAVDLSTPGQTGKAEAAATESRTIRAFSTLESAAQQGAPFLSQQQALAALLPQDAEVAALGTFAQRGAPTIADLRKDLDAAAGSAARLMGDQSDDGWNWLRSAVPGLTPTTPNSGDRNAPTIIAKARRSLESGDTKGAIAIIATLPAPASKAFDPWREKAQRRADLDEKLLGLNRRLLGAVAPTSQGG